MTMRQLSDVQLRALEYAMQRPLKHYRRGYATSKQGPFFGQSTVSALKRIGFVFVREGGTAARLTRAGRHHLIALAGSNNLKM